MYKTGRGYEPDPVATPKGQPLNLTPDWDIRTPSGKIDDAEIARRMQLAEENPYVENIMTEPRLPSNYPMPSAVGKKFSRLKTEALALAKQKEKDAEAKEKAAEARALAAERKAREAEERRPLYAVKKLYGLPSYGSDYKYLLDWGIDYIPAYYSEFERRRIQNLIARLLAKEAKDRSEEEMKEKIKKIIEESEKSKPKSPRRRASPRRKASPKRRKSPRKASPKKRKSPKKKSPKRR